MVTLCLIREGDPEQTVFHHLLIASGELPLVGDILDIQGVVLEIVELRSLRRWCVDVEDQTPYLADTTMWARVRDITPPLPF